MQLLFMKKKKVIKQICILKNLCNFPKLAIKSL